MDRIYLDHLASTPLAPAVREAVLAALEEVGAPTASHAEGRAVRDRLEDARSRAAAAWGCRPREVIFTASGTVACQLGLVGAALARRSVSNRVVITDVEHPAIDDATSVLEERGFRVIRVPPEPNGIVPADAFVDAVGETAAAAAMLLANHETGVMQPVAAVAAALAGRSVPLVVDACLAPGRVPAGRAAIDAHVVALSAHKMGGPRGVGILVVRKGTGVAPLWRGGPQEEGLHAGTPAVALAVGAAVALESALRLQPTRASRYSAALAAFLEALAEVGGWCRVGPPEVVLPGVATIEIDRVEGEAAMINLDLEGIAVSTGSGCALGAREPARTLLAMGFDRRRAANTLRVSVGEGVRDEDARRAGEATAAVCRRLRALARH
jgi:cysteine desulfurase